MLAAHLRINQHRRLELEDLRLESLHDLVGIPNSQAILHGFLTSMARSAAKTG
jgi:hypothetical protein